MSDDSFALPPVPLMPAEKAQYVARAYKAVAENLASIGVAREAARMERDSMWWMAYAISLAQTPDSQK